MDAAPQARWARVGEGWRALSACAVRTRAQRGEEEAFDTLRERMGQDLAALSASPELRSLFEAHATEAQAAMRRRHTRIVAWSDDPGPYGVPRPRHEVEVEVQSLAAPAREGRLTREAGLRAAHALAVQAEYMARSGNPGGDLTKLNAAYTAHALKPGPAADAAGRQAVEWTVDKPGWLTGSRPAEGTDAR